MKAIKILLTMALMAAPFAVSAQDQRPEPPQRPEGSPEKHMQRPEPPKMTIQQLAHQRTDQMDRLLTLTDKQYKKIYKLNLKELKEMEADSLFMGRRGMGFGPGGPGRGPGFGPGGPGGPGGNRAQFERDMARANSEFNPLTQQQMEELKAAHEKSRLKKDKKLRKILTDEQYGKWVKAEQERLIRMQQMRNQRGRGHRHVFGPGMGPGGPGFGQRPDSTGMPAGAPPQAPGEAAPVKTVE
ncbi:MAG: hypothetical protein J6X89_00755 [Bacteroidales bacterium]|nr:hypothetical protein [Bacteroidales bacterium]